MKKALLLVDIQNDYFKNGKSELKNTEVAADKSAKILEHFRNNRELVIYIQHINTRTNATFFLPDTSGCEIHESVKPKENEKIIIKHMPNSFYDTELKEYLDQNSIEELIICGMMSHMCIDTTVRAAKDYGYTVTVLEDACTTKDLQWNSKTIPAETVHQVMMASINGMFGEVMTVEQYLSNH